MRTLTIRGMPDELYRALERCAEANGRSLNDEVIARLEESVAAVPATAWRITAAKDAGRP